MNNNNQQQQQQNGGNDFSNYDNEIEESDFFGKNNQNQNEVNFQDDYDGFVD